jgi:hypothetical protein
LRSVAAALPDIGANGTRRRVVPFTSFSENEALPDGTHPPVWFAFDETRPLYAFFAGHLDTLDSGPLHDDALMIAARGETGAIQQRKIYVFRPAPEQIQSGLMDAGVFVDAAGIQASSKGARVTFSRKEGPFSNIQDLVAGHWIGKANRRPSNGSNGDARPVRHRNPSALRNRRLR